MRVLEGSAGVQLYNLRTKKRKNENTGGCGISWHSGDDFLIHKMCSYMQFFLKFANFSLELSLFLKNMFLLVLYKTL